MTESWVNRASELGVDLMVDVSSAPGSSRRDRLAAALRSAIGDGRLTAGTRLPPYRSLSADLGLARGTVAAVYAELAAEGWLVTRQGSGTRVAEIGGPPPEPTRRPDASGASAGVRRAGGEHAHVRHDFGLGQPDPSLFPRTQWTRSTRRVMVEAPHSLFGRPDPQGHRPLREALAAYLARVRGVRCTADDIILCTSVAQALDILARTVLGPSVAVEAYGLTPHREIVEQAGVTTVGVAVDEDGVDIDGVTASGCRAAVLTPGHQFPTGATLAPPRRTAVVDWVRRADIGGPLVEDDYDGELRYDRDPIAAVQALAPESVIYVGSASKSLSPAVRIGWMVVPSRWFEPVMTIKGDREAHASLVDQAILSDLISSGAYDRHIRRSRARYRQRRDALRQTLAGCGLRVRGISAGLHAVVEIPGADEAATVAVARAAGFDLAGLDDFRHPATRSTSAPAVVVGFGSPLAHRFHDDVRALADLLAAASASTSSTPSVVSRSMHASVTDCP